MNSVSHHLTSLNLVEFFDELENFSKSLHNIISKDLDRIQVYDTKDDFFEYIFTNVNANLYASIDTKLQPILLENNITLTERFNQTETLDIQVKDRVSQVENPIGQLPITLQEAISIFPISLGIGSLISTSLLLECLKLRERIRKFYNKQGLPDKDITNIASPWIDTIESKKKQKNKIFYNELLPQDKSLNRTQS